MVKMVVVLVMAVAVVVVVVGSVPPSVPMELRPTPQRPLPPPPTPLRERSRIGARTHAHRLPPLFAHSVERERAFSYVQGKIQRRGGRGERWHGVGGEGKDGQRVDSHM